MEKISTMPMYQKLLKLPTITQLHEINKGISDRVLTEIQNGIIVRVQQEQKLLKKKASNEQREITRKLNNSPVKTHWTGM